MNWESDDIRKNYYNVIKDSKVLNKVDMEKKYELFILDFRKLYDIAIDSVVSNNVQESIKILDTMLTTRDKVKNGAMTDLSAGLFVGNQLGHKYIYPKTNVPSKDDYKKAIDEIKGKIREEKEKENKN
jgi:hypothetical protein